jgi:hypothetical protein
MPVRNEKLTVPPAPGRNWVGARPEAPARLASIGLKAGVYRKVRGIALVVPCGPASNEHGSEVGALEKDAANRSPVGTNVFHQKPNIRTGKKAASDTGGGRTVGLVGFGSVNAKDANGKGLARGGSSFESIPIGNRDNTCRVGLARINRLR